IRGGENISPKEVEDYLYRMPGVKDVQVVAVASQRYGEDVGAFIIRKEGYQLEAEDVRDFCKGHIAKYKIPRYVFFVDTFPMTGSGKIQKFRLREMALELCEKNGVVIR
ncbi:MAG: AMP-binding protein, partial [Bacteroidales bacterium]|nr:AMP-binding protein [Bacteroidales bacterium]